MAVVQTLHQLAHEAADVLMGELDQAGLQQAHQVVVHVLKHKVKSTWKQKMNSQKRDTILEMKKICGDQKSRHVIMRWLLGASVTS